MRMLLAAAIAALVLAGSSSPAQPAAVLTLEGPPATLFGHRVDFAGRLSPSVPDARIRLLTAGRFVAATTVRTDGTYRIRLRLGRPGPFRASWQGILSDPVVVRVHPYLRTSVTGSRVAGDPLKLEAHLRPSYAGRIRVRVVRDGKRPFSAVFAGAALVHLGTAAPGRFRVQVGTIPARGFAAQSESLVISLRPPTLAYGARSPLVLSLVQRLAALGYAAPSARSIFDSDVLQSVYAFEKAQNLPRTGVADSTFWRRIDQPSPIAPRYRYPASHIEVDKRRQILLLVRGGNVALIAPVSTAGIPGYHTPEGRFAIYRKVPGYDPSPLGVLYDPMYFVGGYAIHGNPSVPPYPASHGCVRVPTFVIERLFRGEPYGEVVYVYS